MSAALASDTALVRPAWARLRFCEVRQAWLLLVPERVLFPCPTTVEVLERLAEPKRLGVLAAELAAEYDAPPEAIEADLGPLLGDLVEKGYVRRADA
ncbi:PqqD family protein [Faunimonas sp. B44]|uniref:PqqD family protein n=1 Tax=Faunimonas sp. B44 TaxID=3461493 RepID=UPI004044C3A5